MAQVEMRDVIVDDEEPSTVDLRPPRARRDRPTGGRPGSRSTVLSPPGRGAAARGAGDAPALPRRLARWPARWPTPLAGVLAVLLLAGVVVEVRQERALAARLDATAGLLGTLDPAAVEEVWRHPGGRRATLAHRGGLVVMTSTTRETLVGLDASSGAPRWEVPLPDGAIDPATACDVVGDGDGRAARYVGCRVVVARPRGVGLPGELEARLMVLDAGTGRTVRERPLENRYATITALGLDLVTVEVPADGRTRVTREDPLTGRASWTFRSRFPLTHGGSPSGPAAPWVDIQHGRLVADGPVAWALAPDGTPLGQWRPPGSAPVADPRHIVDVTVLRDGGLAVGDWGTTRDDGRPFGTVSSSDRRDGFPLPGPVLVPAVDDGTAADVVLTAPTSGRRRIVALDRRTGEELWTARTRVGGQVLVLDRRLVVNTGSDVTAIDVGSGAELWRARVIPTHLELLTDGRVVLVPTWERERGPIFAALDLADGRTRWTAPAPYGVLTYAIGDGRLYALSERETVGLG